MKDFIFPFSTCEKPNLTGIAQPYSVCANFISLCVILYFLCKTVNIYSWYFILSLFIFESFHTFSHYVHLPNYFQQNVTHLSSYVVNALYFLTLYKYTNKLPSTQFSIFLFCLLCFDIYAYIYLSFLFSFVSSTCLFLSILLYYYRFFDEEKKKYIKTIIILVLIIGLLLFNERYNCKKILNVFPKFPLHILLELVGTLTFYCVCNFFYKL
jgi:hypothetical protein